MPTHRTLIVAASLMALVLGGCSSRDQVELNALRSDNARLSANLKTLQEECDELDRIHQAARDELIKAREQAMGLGKQLGDRLGQSGGGVLKPLDGGSRIGVDSNLAFAKGSAELTDEGRKAIGQLAQELSGADYANTNVVIEGHTDNTPVKRPATVQKFGNNWGLSAMRAASVITELQKAGIDASRLRGAFRGQHSPRGSDKAANRRVEIYLSL